VAHILPFFLPDLFVSLVTQLFHVCNFICCVLMFVTLYVVYLLPTHCFTFAQIISVEFRLGCYGGSQYSMFFVC
jgi:hypothetical protein